MRIALIMPPMRYRTNTNWFEALHNFSKGEPQFIRFFDKIRSKRLVDFRSYPLGLLYLATPIKDDHDVRIFNFLDGLTRIEDIISFKPEVVAFTCSTGSVLVWIDEVVEKIKKECGAKIVLGGPHATIDPRTSLETTQADFVIAGEGDFVFKELIENLEGNGPFPEKGVWRKEKGEIFPAEPAVIADLGDLPIPDHSLLDQSNYPGIHIETSRGCRYDCGFCFLSGMPQNRVHRFRPVESIVKELKTAAKLRDLEKSKLYIIDSNFRFNDHIQNLMDALKAEGIKSQFWTATDTYLDRKTIRAMSERGFSFVHSGIEDGISGRFKKISDREHLFEYVSNLWEAGIDFGADFILGYPEQTKEQLSQMLSLARKLAQLSRKYPHGTLTIQPHFFRPFPNTPITRQIIRDGWNAPKTFRQWGELHDAISHGAPIPSGKNNFLSKNDIIKAMLVFSWLNIRYLLLPFVWMKTKNFLGKKQTTSRENLAQ